MILDLRLDQIRESATQPRRTFHPGRLRELAADLAAHGVLQPLVVRPMAALPHEDDAFELVCGARRLRAAAIAGLATVPAIVRNLSDREVLEAQLSENDQRADVDPIEQADGFARLHEEHGVPLDEIAARHGRPRSYVAERLALAHLCTDAREAVSAGRLRVGVALLLARLPAEHQVTATRHLLTHPSALGDSGWTVAEAGVWIRGRYHLRLATAPFDTRVVGLVEGAPSCETCPRTSHAQRDLFEEADSDAQCLDPVCFARKREAAWVQSTAAERAAGRTVLTADQSAAIVEKFGCNGGYVRADIAPTEHGGRRTWKQLLGVSYPEPQIARGPDGSKVEVIPPDALAEAVKLVGLKAKKTSKSSAGDAPVARDGAQERTTRSAIIEAQVAAVRAACEQPPFLLDAPPAWALAARVVASLCAPVDAREAFEDAANLPPSTDALKGLDDRRFEAWLKSANAHDCLTFVSCAAVRAAHGAGRSPSELLFAVRALGVDAGRIESEVRAAAKAVEPQKLVKLSKDVRGPKKAGAK